MVAAMAHDGIARAIRPSHTLYDGDTLFALSTGKRKSRRERRGHVLAADVVAQAILNAVSEYWESARAFNHATVTAATQGSNSVSPGPLAGAATPRRTGQTVISISASTTCGLPKAWVSAVRVETPRVHEPQWLPAVSDSGQRSPPACTTKALEGFTSPHAT